MKRLSSIHAAVFIGVALIAGCGMQNQEITKAPPFDAKAIAAEADKGNLAPLTELNRACTEEVEKSGKRMAVCNIQDEVGKLTKPLGVRF